MKNILAEDVMDWRVVCEDNLGDHNSMTFELKLAGPIVQRHKNIRCGLNCLNWFDFIIDINKEIAKLDICKVQDISDLDVHVANLHKAVNDVWHRNSRKRVVNSRTQPIWWNASLKALRSKVRAFRRRVQKEICEDSRNRLRVEYKKCKSFLKKEIKKAKLSSFTAYK